MAYNTSEQKLVLPEYGRNIHKMVEYTMAIEDRDERNSAARAIISVMGNMNPHLRDIADFKHKLWDHLAIISGFKLDIDSPYPAPIIEELYEKPKTVKYRTREMKYRHFGLIIELLIEEAINIQDIDRKNALIKVITNHMKKSYLMWNKDVVSDELIFEALKELSKGLLVPKTDLRLTDSREIMAKSNKKRTSVPPKRKHK